jgi:glutamate racemase
VFCILFGKYTRRVSEIWGPGQSEVYQTILNEKNIAHRTFAPTTLAGDIERDDVLSVEKNIVDVIEEAQKINATHIMYACTHYPLADELFKSEALESNWKGAFINPAEYLAGVVSHIDITGGRSIRFETSLETAVFKEYSSKHW